MKDKMKIVPIPKKKEPTTATADEVLEAAKGSLAGDMMVIGWNKSEDAVHILTPCKDKASLVYLLEYVKLIILSGEFDNG